MELRWGTYKSFFLQILEAIGHVIRVFKPKTEMPIGGLNSSGWKTNRLRSIKVLNLKASGHELLASKIIYDDSDTFLFIKQITLW